MASGFVSGEEIEAFCGGCESRESRLSKANRSYSFCKASGQACFKAISSCTGQTKPQRPKALIKPLEAFL